MEQRSPEWFAARCGKIGCSRLSAIIAQGKGGGESKTRRTYMIQLAVERLTGVPVETYKNDAMEWGIENESLARSEYEARHGVMVAESGFILHPEMPYFGCSPDGLVGLDGGLEIKCPNTETHIETMLGASIGRAYILQMQGGMAVTGRKFWDFVSYDPRLPAKSRYFERRIERDENTIYDIMHNVMKFENELNELMEVLK